MKECPVCHVPYVDNLKFCVVDGEMLVDCKKCLCSFELSHSITFCPMCGRLTKGVKDARSIPNSV